MSAPPGPRRRELLVPLAAVAVAGLACKLYDGPGQGWVNDSLAGLLYVVFWCLAAAFALPRAAPGRIAVAVLAVTCALEVAQLWRAPWLQRIRGTFPGAALLGTTFVASDFVYYALGAGIAWAWIWRRQGSRPRRPEAAGTEEAGGG